MKMKYSKIKAFKIATGEHLLALQDKLSNTIDQDERFATLEKLALGLYLVNNYNVQEAKSEYTRLRKSENEDERYSIIDDVDLDDEIEKIIG
jgi:hypothetical protein|nr:MAG TPA: hypothetical protein [Caudoviricetes sp.]